MKMVQIKVKISEKKFKAFIINYGPCPCSQTLTNPQKPASVGVGKL